MKTLLPLAALTLTLVGCSSPSADWDTPQPRMTGDNAPPYQPTMHCTKKGCHQDKPMLFDPTKAEPDATTLHRGW
ncbi:hypothetical protein [Pseudomonas sp. H9]|uniref:hypothetical protein n=1 Tax=Pseudomonas sp. H9 TaxID=483968 RepID=UPI00105788A5|nr:hypothetical protein [Pseudomonas sp. H9]TDF79990.1 hypothetical protein E1573_20970 [Pseudomonas sp. H9]